MSDHSSSTHHAFTDLMTSLVVIFVLLLVAVLYQMKVATEKEERRQMAAKENVSSVSDELLRRLKVLGLKLEPDDDDPEFTAVVRLDENAVRFEVGKDALNIDGKTTIRKVSDILADVICENRVAETIESLIVEGHTDKKGDDSTDGKLRNVDLSQKRAFAVMREVFYHLDSSSGLAVDCFRKLARATGRGAAKPYSLHDDDSNRRVEVKIRFRNKVPTQVE